MIDYYNYSNKSNDFVKEEEVPNDEIFDVVEDIEVEEEIEDVSSDLIEAKVSAEKIYLRQGPGKDKKDIAVLNRGEELLVDLIKSTDEWFNVCTVTGVEGFVMKSLVTTE